LYNELAEPAAGGFLLWTMLSPSMAKVVHILAHLLKTLMEMLTGPNFVKKCVFLESKRFKALFLFFFWWDRGLNSMLCTCKAGVLLLESFCSGYFGDGVLQTIYLG
jgi:hypothetical protein